ncbi:hypothetical protein MTO96_002490 [Rhipicephalus appendiculatus]
MEGERMASGFSGRSDSVYRDSGPRKAENKTRSFIRTRSIGEPSAGRLPSRPKPSSNSRGAPTTYEDSAKIWAPLSGITKPSTVISDAHRRPLGNERKCEEERERRWSEGVCATIQGAEKKGVDCR